MLEILATYLVIGIAISFWNSIVSGDKTQITHVAFALFWLPFFLILISANLIAFLVLLFRTSRNIILDIIDNAFAVTKVPEPTLVDTINNLTDKIQTFIAGK